MGEYYQQGYHNSTADYAGRVAGYAGTSLKESRQSKAQTPTQNKTRDSAEDSRPKLPFADFIDDLANAAWVGVKKANETILNVQSAIMNGAIGLGSAAIGGVKTFGERSKNLVKSIADGDGLNWEDDSGRAERIYQEYFNQSESSMYATGDAGNNYYSVQSQINGTSYLMGDDSSIPGISNAPKILKDIINPFNMINEPTPEELSDRNSMGQSSDSKYYGSIKGMLSDIRGGDLSLELDNKLNDSRNLMVEQIDDKNEMIQQLENDKDISAEELKTLKTLKKEVNDLSVKVKDINNREEYINAFSKTINDPNTDLSKLAKQIGGGTCCIQSYWQLGVLEKDENRDCFDFYREEVQKGNIQGSDYNFVTGSGNWDKAWGIEVTRKEIGEFDSQYELDKQLNNAKREAVKKGEDPDSVVITEEMRQNAKITKYAPIDKNDTIEKLNQAGAKHAIFWLNTRSPEYSQEPTGNHFIIGVKNEKGNWINYDHCSNKRSLEINWNQVRDVRYKKLLFKR